MKNFIFFLGFQNNNIFRYGIYLFGPLTILTFWPSIDIHNDYT